MRAERRRHERVPIRGDARLVQDGKEARFSARDLSLGGAFLTGSEGDGVDLTAGRPLDIVICPDEESPHHALIDGATFHAGAKIVRSDTSGVAVAFVRMDLENEGRLRALVDVGGD